MESLPDGTLCIELLNARYDLSLFDSGDEELNSFVPLQSLIGRIIEKS